MKFSTSIFLMFLSINTVFGQITLTKDDFPDAGTYTQLKVGVYQTDKVPQVIQDLLDTTVKNFDLDFTQIQTQANTIDTFFAPEDLAGGDEITSADFGYKTQNGNVFFRKDDNYLNMIGIGIVNDQLPVSPGFEYDKPLAFTVAPLTYPAFYSDSTSSEKSFVLGKIVLDASTEYRVNGYGKVSLPDSSFEVLRMKRKYLFKVTLESPFGNQTTLDSIVLWECYTKGVPNSVIRVETSYVRDNMGIITDTVVVLNHYDKDITTSVFDENNDLIVESLVKNNSLYMSAKQDFALSIYNLNGQELYTNSIQKDNYRIDGLPQGVIIINAITNDGKVYKRKLFIH